MSTDKLYAVPYSGQGSILGLEAMEALAQVLQQDTLAYGPTRDKFEAEFLDKTFAPDEATRPAEPRKATRSDLDALRGRAEAGGSADAWRELGDGLAIWGGIDQIDAAIDAYTRALRLGPKDADAHFRLGVC